ncbi:YceK/YidQ family lipoprotein [Pseudomonas sp. R5(2019)]|uniref:YceK/YidQ family lipoprotein n=1 Tax=Pseudomonas sp. R5(2019) TaxID=2697566 RepID=UPI0014131E45|nr:YceK/YidQ family lipoprotein [Pseudomonas sp. R5(2019)]NBA97497.1 YceK/YidQ family lipoprotein [Pseudomonas sp. R5(2019)]
MKRRLVLVALAVAVQLVGCATVSTLNAAKPGAPIVYSGTRLDLYAMKGGCCPEDRFGVAAPRYPALDLPGSALLDTVLLPLSVLTVLGVEFQATGGL